MRMIVDGERERTTRIEAQMDGAVATFDTAISV
jgi:hypothetical protein